MVGSKGVCRADRIICYIHFMETLKLMNRYFANINELVQIFYTLPEGIQAVIESRRAYGLALFKCITIGKYKWINLLIFFERINPPSLTVVIDLILINCI